MDSLVNWFASSIGQWVSAPVAVFIISMIPILECRGGLVAAALLKVPIVQAVPLCILGNLLPIPVILLFLKRVFQWMKRFKLTAGLVQRLERRGQSRSQNFERGAFVSLLLFVGIPLPGTGAWTGALIASLLDMKIKPAFIAILLGVLLATLIVGSLSYGLLSVLGL